MNKESSSDAFPPDMNINSLDIEKLSDGLINLNPDLSFMDMLNESSYIQADDINFDCFSSCYDSINENQFLDEFLTPIPDPTIPSRLELDHTIISESKEKVTTECFKISKQICSSDPMKRVFKQCANCSVTATSTWRRDKNNQRLLWYNSLNFVKRYLVMHVVCI